MPSRLETELSEALSDDAIEQLLLICDNLHEAVPVEGYTANDLPSDEIYEQYSLKIGHVNPFSDVVKGSIMFMGSVYKPKPEEEIVVDDIILSPKYDGTSLAIRFIKDGSYFKPVEAHTKGRDVGGEHVNQDVIEKIKYFLPSIEVKPSAASTFEDVVELHVRGEFICRNKLYDAEGNPAACHANVASGQLNRLFSEFKKDLQNFDFVGYELAKVFRIVKGNRTEVIPTQKQATQLLKKLLLNYKLNPQEPMFSGTSWHANSSADVDFASSYERILEVERHPTDGIVYCAESWKYPTDESAFKSKFYGKYAWKPQSAKHVVAKGIEYSMAKDGDINFNVLYEPTLLNGKTYCRAKAGTNKLQNLIDAGLGEGAVCVLELKNDVIPYVSTVITKSKVPFKLPLKCPFCDKKLNYISDKKNELRHIKCENENCGVLLITKWTKFIGSMNKIFKKNNGKILETLNDSGESVKSAISEKKLEKIAETKRLNRETIESYMPTLFTEFEKLDLETQLTVLGIGGAKAVKKLIKDEGYSNISDVPNVWIYEV